MLEFAEIMERFGGTTVRLKARNGFNVVTKSGRRKRGCMEEDILDNSKLLEVWMQKTYYVNIMARYTMAIINNLFVPCLLVPCPRKNPLCDGQLHSVSVPYISSE